MIAFSVAASREGVSIVINLAGRLIYDIRRLHFHAVYEQFVYDVSFLRRQLVSDFLPVGDVIHSLFIHFSWNISSAIQPVPISCCTELPVFPHFDHPVIAGG